MRSIANNILHMGMILRCFPNYCINFKISGN
jgi:hypothetical protein